MSDTENDNVSSELAAVLDRLRGEGELSSEGVFTVDLTKALPKLEKFQLPEPHFGLLKVIQSAVVSNATRINTSFSSGAIRIEHNGIAPHPSELREILSYLMSPDFPTHQRALRDLAIGVNTTLSRGGSWVEVSVKDGQEWVSQRWTKRDESEQLQKSHSDRSDMTTRFAMRRTVSQVASRAWSLAKKDIFDLMEKNRDVMDEDSRAVFDRCRHAPVEITIEGKPIPESSFGRVVTKRWSLRTVKEHRRPNMMEIFLLTDVDSPHLLSPPVDSESRFKFYVPGVLKDGRILLGSHASSATKR